MNRLRVALKTRSAEGCFAFPDSKKVINQFLFCWLLLVYKARKFIAALRYLRFTLRRVFESLIHPHVVASVEGSVALLWSFYALTQSEANFYASRLQNFRFKVYLHCALGRVYYVTAPLDAKQHHQKIIKKSSNSLKLLVKCYYKWLMLAYCLGFCDHPAYMEAC